MKTGKEDGAVYGREQPGQLSVISFTENGKRLSRVIKETMGHMEVTLYTKHGSSQGQECEIQPLPVETSVGMWAKTQMEQGSAMVFIGACGIAVRAVAPYITDKLHDCPVLVMDELGKYVISVLAGHMGGATQLACQLAEKTGAQPVITTATDLNGKFAVDLFAKRNRLFIEDSRGIGSVSARALEGKLITLSVETGHWRGKDPTPEGVCLLDYGSGETADVVVTSRSGEFGGALLLRPKEYVIGMGCRKGKDAGQIEAFILREIEKLGISVEQISGLASISQKSREEGMVAWCRKERVPFIIFDAKELGEMEGEFCGSAFVEKTVGVDNVCERAALKACGPGGKLVWKKQSENGMTIAVAKREWMVDFYGE